MIPSETPSKRVNERKVQSAKLSNIMTPKDVVRCHRTAQL